MKIIKNGENYIVQTSPLLKRWGSPYYGDDMFDILKGLPEVAGREKIEAAYAKAHPKVLALFKAVGAKLIAPPNYGRYAAMFITNYGLYDAAADTIYAHELTCMIGELDTYLLHELTHWTGSPKRLRRFSITDDYPILSQMRADEEYTAQVGMVLLAQELGVLPLFTLQQYLSAYTPVITRAYNTQPNYGAATDDAYRAVGYLKLMAPEIFSPTNYDQGLDNRPGLGQASGSQDKIVA